MVYAIGHEALQPQDGLCNWAWSFTINGNQRELCGNCTVLGCVMQLDMKLYNHQTQFMINTSSVDTTNSSPTMSEHTTWPNEPMNHCLTHDPQVKYTVIPLNPIEDQRWTHNNIPIHPTCTQYPLCTQYGSYWTYEHTKIQYNPKIHEQHHLEHEEGANRKGHKGNLSANRKGAMWEGAKGAHGLDNMKGAHESLANEGIVKASQ